MASKHLDLRCVLLPDPSTDRWRGSQPKHVSNPVYKRFNLILFILQVLVLDVVLHDDVEYHRRAGRQVRRVEELQDELVSRAFEHRSPRLRV